MFNCAKITIFGVTLRLQKKIKMIYEKGACTYGNERWC